MKKATSVSAAVLIDTMPSMEKKNEDSQIKKLFSKCPIRIRDPAEFELPDTWIECKPTAYRSIRRNIYLTKKNKKRPDDDGIFCSCTGSSDVCGRDCLCGMLQSSCSSGCKCGSSCLNKPFQQRPVKKMRVVQTEKCGSGIVVDEDIKKGEFIIEYVGEVIDDETCADRLWKLKHSGEKNFYLCEINRDMVIDATYKGNKSRFINHSCSPNTQMQKWRIDNETRIGIFATRDIKIGEHLTYDYKFVQFGADQDCHCGAAECRKKLGTKAKSKTPSSDAVASQAVVDSSKVYGSGTSSSGVKCNSAMRKYPRNCIGETVTITRSTDESPNLNEDSLHRKLFGLIKRFDKTTKKHLILFEDGTLESLDMSKEEWEFL